jgi:hypothetical protein
MAGLQQSKHLMGKILTTLFKPPEVIITMVTPSTKLTAHHIPIIKIMFDATSIINNFDNVEVPTATTFRRITSRLKKIFKCLLDVRDTLTMNLLNTPTE